jgi:hypothetical protein
LPHIPNSVNDKEEDLLVGWESEFWKPYALKMAAARNTTSNVACMDVCPGVLKPWERLRLFLLTTDGADLAVLVPRFPAFI